MDFEWDPNKAERKLRKHGVEFVDALTVFDDHRAITLTDDHPNEDRYVTLAGMHKAGCSAFPSDTR